MIRLPFPILCLAGLLTILACRSTDQEPVSSDNSAFPTEKIDSICQAFLGKNNTVGFSLAISKNGNPVYAKGFGQANIEEQKVATENTIYPIASVSKFITAAITMKLVEEGKINLEDKVVSHFEEFPEQEFMEEITLEHLLRHQSGLVDHEDWFDSIYINERRVFTLEELFEFLDQPLFFRPGSQYSYSNSGFAILSAILEKISGLSFHELVVQTIGKPTGSSSLGMWPESWDRAEATMGYELSEEGVDTSFHMMTEGMKGDGGLSASVIDLLKFGNSLAEYSLVSKPSMDKILSPTPVGPINIDYGLGVKWGEIKGHKTWGHSGGYKGTGWAMLTHYPESGYTFAAAQNTNYSPEEIWLLRHLVMPEVLGISPYPMKVKTIENIEMYSGEYLSINRWGTAPPSVRVVSEKDGRLYWDNPDTETPGAELFLIGEHTFTFKAFPYDEFKFHVLDGQVVGCSVYYDGTFGTYRTKN